MSLLSSRSLAEPTLALTLVWRRSFGPQAPSSSSSSSGPGGGIVARLEPATAAQAGPTGLGGCGLVLCVAKVSSCSWTRLNLYLDALEERSAWFTVVALRLIREAQLEAELDSERSFELVPTGLDEPSALVGFGPERGVSAVERRKL